MKTCSKCKTEKPYDEFTKNSGISDGYSRYCRDCGRASNKRYFHDNKKVFAERHNRRRKAAKAHVDQFKQERGCYACGETKPWRLDLHHHNDDKESNVATLVSDGRSITIINEEMDKCMVVCKNCHADIHFGQGLGVA